MLNQLSKVWPWAGGIGAFRCTFTAASISVRIGLFRSTALASGATGVIIVPISVVCAISRSRSGMWSAFITARAWLFSSAIWTPCGQTSVHVPQLEQ